MARGQDLTKTLEQAEILRLRALLAERPDLSDMPEGGGEYPRMLFHESFLEAQRAWKKQPHPETKKTASEAMAFATHVVFDADEETEYLADGWKRSPADFLPPEKDPRIPVGREARKAHAQQAQSREREIRELRARLAELTGEIAPLPVPVAAPPRRKGGRPAKDVREVPASASA